MKLFAKAGEAIIDAAVIGIFSKIGGEIANELFPAIYETVKNFRSFIRRGKKEEKESPEEDD